MRFAITARQIRSWIGASWSNLVTVVLIGIAAGVSAAAGWDQHHHVQWLVAAAVIAALGGLAQVSVQAHPGRPTNIEVRLGAWLTKDQKGVEFAIFSKDAKKVELCLILTQSAVSGVSPCPGFALPRRFGMVTSVA